MKKSTKAKSLLLFSLLLFSFSNFAQIGETHTITLLVNTAEIDDASLSTHANFGQRIEVSNEEFTIHVKRGDQILWQGISTNAPETDEVRIVSIQYESGRNLFGQNNLKDSGQAPGLIAARISQGEEGDVQKYNVVFKVFNGGDKRGTYTIDPKIQMHN